MLCVVLDRPLFFGEASYLILLLILLCPPPPCATAHRYTAAEILSWHQATEPSAALKAMDLPELMSEKSQIPEVRGEARERERERAGAGGGGGGYSLGER